jgi:hypothetical protein
MLRLSSKDNNYAQFQLIRREEDSLSKNTSIDAMVHHNNCMLNILKKQSINQIDESDRESLIDGESRAHSAYPVQSKRGAASSDKMKLNKLALGTRDLKKAVKLRHPS